MRRALALVIAVSVLALVVDASAVAAPSARIRAPRYVPTPFPDGWFVTHATAPVAGSADRTTSFFASRDDPMRGPALATASVGVESGFDELRDDHPRRVAELAGSRLARNGRFAWLTWPDDDAQDTKYLLAGRDLDDRELIAAARAIQASKFPARGVPDGLDAFPGADVSVGGAASAQRITLVNAEGMRRVELEVSAGSRGVRAAQEFWAEQEARREHRPGRRRAAVVGRQQRVTVVARGDASPRELQRLANSMRPTDAAGWDALRRRVADLPVTALFPGFSVANGNGVVLDGFLDDTRWGVAFDNGPLAAASTTIVTADLTSSGSGPGVPADGLPDVLSGGSVSTNGGSIFAGVIPAGAASARFVPEGREPVDAVLGPPTPDGAHRYFAAWVPGVAGTVPLVVYDENGAVLLQRQKFGCNVCG